MSENPLGSLLKFNCKIFIHSPDPATESYGEPSSFLQETALSIINCDDRSIDELCKSVVTDLARAFIPHCNSPENVQRCLEFYGNENNFKFSYITPPFYGPGNEGVSMVDFVKAYKAENPEDESAEIVINLFRWNERPWVEEDFSFVKNNSFSVKRFLKKQFLKNKSYYRGVIDSLVVFGSVLLASHLVYKHE